MKTVFTHVRSVGSSARLGFACLLMMLALPAQAAVFANGADVGWLTQMEASGVKFFNASGTQQDLLQVLQGVGINSIRVRVWVNPSAGWNNQADVVAKAVRAKNRGHRIMIDFHYSDTWADPGQQAKPAAWASHGISQLRTDVATHTTAVLNALKSAGVTPEWVQVGNETNNGMLWEDGRASTSMSNFANLIASGSDAVKAVFPGAKVIVHISNGFDNGLFRWIFDGLQANGAGAKYDVIGMSLYPTTTNWSTLNSQTLTNMNDMVARYGKEVMVVEVGMEVNAAATAKSFITDIINKTKSVAGGKGLGVFYWEPGAYNSWQGYTKGAFGSNGRPTIAMDAFASGANLVTNPGFETGGASQTPSGWSSAGTAVDADKSEAGGHSGALKLTHWKASAYQVTTFQTKAGLVNGTYTLRAWVMSGGGQTTVRLYAKNFGGTEKNLTLPTTSTWTQISITGINVTNGQCEIGLTSTANANQWANLDDVELLKN